MNIKSIRNTMMTLTVSVIISAGVSAQATRSDVIKAFNDGVNASKTDVKASITAFENSVVLADQVGETAADLKEKAIKVIPGLYVKLANNAIAEKKPGAEIVKSAKTAAAIAEKYNNATAKENSKKIMIVGYKNIAADYFSKNEYEKALQTFDSILFLNPDYSDAIYNKALIYMRQDSTIAFEKTVDSYIDKMKPSNDTAKIKNAQSMALGFFRSEGSKSSQANKLDEAITLLDKAAKYGVDKDLYYYYSDVYNKQKNFDKGAEYAQKGLALETGTAEAKAKFYYQLGFAQMNKGQTPEACASFKNATFGAFAEAAKANLKNLKCE